MMRGFNRRYQETGSAKPSAYTASVGIYLERKKGDTVIIFML